MVLVVPNDDCRLEKTVTECCRWEVAGLPTAEHAEAVPRDESVDPVADDEWQNAKRCRHGP
jgi:hypothetical protein